MSTDDVSAGATDGSLLRPASDIIARNLGDAAVLIRLTTNRIYELNATGSRIWDLLKHGTTREQVIETLRHEFDVPADVLASSVDELIAMLRAEGLISRQ